MTQEKRVLERVTVRLYADTFEAAKKAAAERTAAEGKRITYNDVVREWAEVANDLMQFEMNPTDAAAASKLLHSNTTIAAAGAFQFLQSQTSATQ